MPFWQEQNQAHGFFLFSLALQCFYRKPSFLSGWPFRFTSGCSCLTVVTTSFSTKTNTATSGPSKPDGTQDSVNPSVTKKCKIAQTQILQRDAQDETEAFQDVRGLGHYLWRKICEVKNHKIGENEQEDVPSHHTLRSSSCFLF